MSLIEALKSGKPFRRKGHEIYYSRASDTFTFHIDQLLANDFELMPDPKPRLRAYRHKNIGDVKLVLNIEELFVGANFENHAKHWERCEWLDQPESPRQAGRNE